MNDVVYNEGFCCGVMFHRICSVIQSIICCCVPSRQTCIDISGFCYECISDCCCCGDYEYCLICCSGFYNGYTNDKSINGVIQGAQTISTAENAV